MKNVFAVPDGTVVILICRTKLPIVFCGRHLPPTLMGIARSVRENWAVVPAGLDSYEFMISEELIRQTGMFPPGFLEETTQLERAFVPLMEPITGQFLKRMDALFHRANGANGSAGAGVHRARLFDFIIHGLIQVIDAGLSARGSEWLRRTRRPDLVKNGRDFILAHLTDDFSMDDMAKALNVSYRVLNYAFRDSLGMSPYQYVLTEKLHGVRRQLLESDVSVTEALASHGFSVPSRFSRQYVRLFGELPSETRYPNRRRAA